MITQLLWLQHPPPNQFSPVLGKLPWSIYLFLVLTPLDGLGSSAASSVFGAAFSLAAALALPLAARRLASGATFALGNGIARDRDSRMKASCTLSWMVDDGDLNSGGYRL